MEQGPGARSIHVDWLKDNVIFRQLYVILRRDNKLADIS